MASLSLPPPRKVAPAPRSTNVATKLAPAPSSSHDNGGGDAAAMATKTENHVPSAGPPSYAERCQAARQASSMTAAQRQQAGIALFVPRALADFADGGAFPEIHVAQYPRHMGNPHLKQKQNHSTTNVRGAQNTTSNALVNVLVDADGKVSYDAIVQGGTNSDKLVYSRHADLRGSEPAADDIARPTAEEEAAEAAQTQAALSAIVSQHTALDKPAGSALQNAATSQNVAARTQFVQYTPNPQAPGYNPAAAQRVIQMVPKQVDPMMPPKHKHIKAPKGPAEDPVPVLHAPPSKLSKEEKAAWNIPACISNWKNTRGYTIPLDKRLAADGRGLRDHGINSDNFATLAESLYVAEQQARQEVKLRAQVQKKLALQEQQSREDELRQLAQQARRQRGDGGGGGGITGVAAGDDAHEDASDVDSAPLDEDGDSPKAVAASSRNDDKLVTAAKAAAAPLVDYSSSDDDDEDDQAAARQRERLRLERKREREREMRLENNQAHKKKRLEEERDVSEKIALGVHVGHGGGGGGGGDDDVVDARLYAQSAGMDSGFGADDEYNAYSKPLFGQQHAAASASIYRPTRGETAYNADEQVADLQAGATTRFQPDQGFAGAEGGGAAHAAGPRTAPVQFEKGEK